MTLKKFFHSAQTYLTSGKVDFQKRGGGEINGFSGILTPLRLKGTVVNCRSPLNLFFEEMITFELVFILQNCVSVKE